MGSGPTSSQNLFFASHQQPPRSPWPRHAAHVSGHHSHVLGILTKPLLRPLPQARVTDAPWASAPERHVVLPSSFLKLWPREPFALSIACCEIPNRVKLRLDPKHSMAQAITGRLLAGRSASRLGGSWILSLCSSCTPPAVSPLSLSAPPLSLVHAVHTDGTPPCTRRANVPILTIS